MPEPTIAQRLRLIFIMRFKAGGSADFAQIIGLVNKGVVPHALQIRDVNTRLLKTARNHFHKAKTSPSALAINNGIEFDFHERSKRGFIRFVNKKEGAF